MWTIQQIYHYWVDLILVHILDIFILYDILIFTASESDIKKISKILEKYNDEENMFMVIILTSERYKKGESYRDIIKPITSINIVKNGRTINPRRRIILSTNVAETGITIPLWADLRVRPSLDGHYFEAEFNVQQPHPNARAGKIEPFGFNQTGACPFTERRDKSVQGANYLKLVSPWNVRTAKGYSVMITSSLVNPRPEFDVVAGVVNTDYYHTVNVVLNVLTDRPFYIAQGTPIAQLIIFKRKDNANSLIFGDEGLFHAHEGLGFGGPWVPSFKRKGKYRREQRRWDR